jgi:uncharacterized membrane protein SirB2
MMHAAYKILHFAGIAALMLSLGALSLHAFGGGKREDTPARPLVLATHGLGLVLMLVSGFGMMARLQLSYGAPWFWGKVLLWLVLGGLVALLARAPKAARFVWPALPVLVGLGGTFAYFLVRSPR